MGTCSPSTAWAAVLPPRHEREPLLPVKFRYPHDR